MITRVELENWRSHAHSCFELGKGTNLFMGVMGSGKSSLVEAICFGLFGTFPALSRRRVKLEEISFGWPNPAGECCVRVFFEKDGSAYEAERRVSQKTTRAYLKKDSRLVQSQSERVTEEIARVLSIDYDLFSRAIYGEQNSIDHLLTLGPRERKKQVDELLGISRFESARENCVRVQGRLKERRDDLLKQSSFQDSSNLEEQITKTKADLDTLAIGIEDMAKKEVSLSNDFSLKSMELENLEKTFRMYSQSKQALERLKGEYAAVSPELEEKPVDEVIFESKKTLLAQLKENATASRSSLQALRKQQTEASMQLGGLASRAAELEKKLAELNALAEKTRATSSEELAFQLEQAKALLEKKVAESASLSKELGDLAKALEELSRASAQCPVCDSPLDSAKRDSLLSQKQERKKTCFFTLETLKSEVPLQRRKIASLEQELRSIQENAKKMSEKPVLEELLSKTKAEQAGLGVKQLELSKQLSDAEAEQSSLEQQASRAELELKNTGELLKKKTRKLQLEKEMSALEQTLASLKFDEALLSSARAVCSELSASIRETRTRKESSAREQAQLSQLLSERVKRLAELVKVKQEAEFLSQVVDSLSAFSNSLKATQLSLREELVEAVNESMDAFWSKIYPYGDFKSVRLRAEEADYSLELRRGDSWVYADGNCSGGERACACLAMRIAFASVLAPNLSWLILDEPTHNLDREAVASLALALSGEIPKMVEQTIVITHEPGLREAATARVYTLSRDKASMEATHVEASSEAL